MMLVERANASRVVLALLTCLAVQGCTKDKPAAMASASSTSSPATRAELLAEATGNTDYGPERNAVPVDTTRVNKPGGTLPTITVATATRRDTSGRLASSHFIGRLTSSGAFPQLGLAPGINYLWRDTLGAPPERVRTLVVPADTTYAMYWLKHESEHIPIAMAPADMPRLVKSSMGYAICDTGCPPGHCVAVQTLSAFIAASDTTLLRSR